ncbi:penicillin-binding protein 2 [Caldichromatium japonicum]|uniref:Peptidoglycan D,D-transpeptidase MrdA n=1 Tax=Caldichromatium japonicum TaxID=2699430 RepID=A0A6G7VA91_9GAMM|nr:penicillin-binding protein 2 [Caldichromatium japonicum]QIK36931.1 penicillin-binding protein 2 [Caldichromatium japonicum]
MLASSLEDRERERRLVRTRLAISALFFVLGLALILIQLYYLQIEHYDHFAVLSTENRVKIQPVPPSRGLIFDARGVLLADNHPSFSLMITIEKVRDLSATIAALKSLIAIQDSDLARFERLKRQRMRFQPVPIRQNLTAEEVARFAVDSYRFPGVEVQAELIRSYPHGLLTAHVLGYVGRINEDDLKRIDKSNYAGTNFIGKGGVELAHEDVLHGRVGYQQVEVNARGRILRTLENTPPIPGQDLYLYLDIRLQQAATEALGANRGAIVAIDPRTGGVLAMVSQPSFDPNPFVEGISKADYQALLRAPDRPLYNRAIRGQYPPGSTVKPFVGLGGLALGFITPRKTVYCPGYFSLPGQAHRFRCWRRGGHGTVDLELGIVQSCDVYFYSLANQIGVDKLHAFLTEFGFGRRTGVDVAGELAGLLPSRTWKEQVRKQPWYPGETLIMGIGQGYFLATPMQLAAATAALANKGRFIQPRLAYARRVPGATTATAFPMISRQIQIPNPGDWNTIIDAMAKVVESPRGTAKRIHSNDYRIAGKTGTSQVFTIGQKERYDAAKVPIHLRDHALFIAFAPVEDPRIAVAVLVENGGSGGATAAPIARRVIDAYLGGTPLNDPEETSGGD